jgi:RNA polymerase sigma-70 factor, ECF subfamily
VAHRIDPAEETVQASGRRSPTDRVPVESRRMKLCHRDDSVLAGRNAGDNPVRLDAFLSHTETKASRRDCAPRPLSSRTVIGDETGLNNEQDLIDALRGGDQVAFAKLVDELSPGLLRLAMAHVPSRAVAEEVLQDTWLGVINGIDRFEGRSSLRTWIYRILLNNARTKGVRERRTLPFSSLRRRGEEGRDDPAVDADRFQGRRGEAPGGWARPPVEWSSPEVKLASDEARQVMLEAIAALPPRQREVLTLRDLQGLSAEEARNALEVSETNQRVLLHRARSKVRAALEKHFEAEENET